jgi:asparagine synthase (glutamine-hydrolysing)
MCGLTGILGVGALTNEALLHAAHRMTEVLGHRGPDGSGYWVDREAGIALGHRRLAILDLSPSGHQPMHSACGRYVIVFNGEIYNFQELHSELERGGYAPNWRGHSDTETLLAGFSAWGIEATLRKSVGMFAFAVWDTRDHALTLARDRVGEKPLYYGWLKGSLIFGSELKALRACPGFEAEIDRNALSAFMRYSYVPAPQSIYRGIQKLLPGTFLTVRGQRHTSTQGTPYWSFSDAARAGMQSPFAGSIEEGLQALETRLAEAVRIQQIADVPVGAFLSGGIDSSAIVALMQAQSIRPVRTFTIGFRDPIYNEAVNAKAVAQHLGTDHTELYVTPADALSVIPQLPVLYDEPFADPSQIPTFLVCQLARRRVTVALSGDAGDELFGGYNRYVWASKLLRYPALARRLCAGALAALSPHRWDQLYAAAQKLLPARLQMRTAGDKAHKLSFVLGAESDAAVYERLVSAWPNPDAVVLNGQCADGVAAAWEAMADYPSIESRMMALDARTYLPDDILCKVDRAAMAVSLETRAPFLDHRVVEFAWSLPLRLKIVERKGKWVLRQLLGKYLPAELVERPKMGFGVPLYRWLRGPLREWAEDLLDESRLQKEGYFNPVPIRRAWVEHLSGRRNWQYRLWNVLMFQSWLAEQRASDERKFTTLSGRYSVRN